MSRYTKKPITINAFQWDGKNPDGNHESWPTWAWESSDISWTGNSKEGWLAIQTLEGEIFANSGDWIIRGVKGEIYPCKPDIFEATYEPAESRPPSGNSDPVTPETAKEAIERDLSNLIDRCAIFPKESKETDPRYWQTLAIYSPSGNSEGLEAMEAVDELEKYSMIAVLYREQLQAIRAALSSPLSVEEAEYIKELEEDRQAIFEEMVKLRRRALSVEELEGMKKSEVGLKYESLERAEEWNAAIQAVQDRIQKGK